MIYWFQFLLFLRYNRTSQSDTIDRKSTTNILVTFEKEENIEWDIEGLKAVLHSSFPYFKYMIIMMQKRFEDIYETSFKGIANNPNFESIKERENLKFFFNFLDKYTIIPTAKFKCLNNNFDSKLVYKKLVNLFEKKITIDVNFESIPINDYTLELIFEYHKNKKEENIKKTLFNVNAIEKVDKFINILYEFYLEEKSYLTEYLNIFSSFDEHYNISKNYGMEMILNTKQCLKNTWNSSCTNFRTVHIINPSFYSIKLKQPDFFMDGLKKLFENIKKSSYKKLIIHFHIREKNLNEDKENENVNKNTTEDVILIKNFFDILSTNLDKGSSIKLYFSFDRIVEKACKKFICGEDELKNEFKANNQLIHFIHTLKSRLENYNNTMDEKRLKQWKGLMDSSYINKYLCVIHDEIEKSKKQEEENSNKPNETLNKKTPPKKKRKKRKRKNTDTKTEISQEKEDSKVENSKEHDKYNEPTTKLAYLTKDIQNDIAKHDITRDLQQEVSKYLNSSTDVVAHVSLSEIKAVTDNQPLNSDDRNGIKMLNGFPDDMIQAITLVDVKNLDDETRIHSKRVCSNESNNSATEEIIFVQPATIAAVDENLISDNRINIIQTSSCINSINKSEELQNVTQNTFDNNNINAAVKSANYQNTSTRLNFNDSHDSTVDNQKQGVIVDSGKVYVNLNEDPYENVLTKSTIQEFSIESNKNIEKSVLSKTDSLLIEPKLLTKDLVYNSTEKDHKCSDFKKKFEPIANNTLKNKNHIINECGTTKQTTDTIIQIESDQEDFEAQSNLGYSSKNDVNFSSKIKDLNKKEISDYKINNNAQKTYNGSTDTKHDQIIKDEIYDPNDKNTNETIDQVEKIGTNNKNEVCIQIEDEQGDEAMDIKKQVGPKKRPSNCFNSTKGNNSSSFFSVDRFKSDNYNTQINGQKNNLNTYFIYSDNNFNHQINPYDINSNLNKNIPNINIDNNDINAPFYSLNEHLKHSYNNLNRQLHHNDINSNLNRNIPNNTVYTNDINAPVYSLNKHLIHLIKNLNLQPYHSNINYNTNRFITNINANNNDRNEHTNNSSWNQFTINDGSCGQYAGTNNHTINNTMTLEQTFQLQNAAPDHRKDFFGERNSREYGNEVIQQNPPSNPEQITSFSPKALFSEYFCYNLLSHVPETSREMNTKGSNNFSVMQYMQADLHAQHNGLNYQPVEYVPAYLLLISSSDITFNPSTGPKIENMHVYQYIGDYVQADFRGQNNGTNEQPVEYFPGYLFLISSSDINSNPSTGPKLIKVHVYQYIRDQVVAKIIDK